MSVQKNNNNLTDLHDPSKNGRVVHCAAVPPPLSKLVLALLDARLGSVSDVHHVVLIELAQLPLTLRMENKNKKYFFLESAYTHTDKQTNRKLPGRGRTAECTAAEHR